ncbi:hypothetical protein HK097_007282 [Rhizophlyctis rosea]|uniref:Uncharacterized protein n=1 Tax=Rhizophlyctis rosea TaxID=64517 RepID=A0AAD5SBU7_9FUNG|nr:hypothetical protein HK097_007282 [Rhizophlyctis rosea]
MKFLALLTLALATVASAAPAPEPAVVVKTVVVKVAAGSSTSKPSSSSSTSYGGTSSAFSSSFKKATIDGHNNARAATGKKMPKLVWSDKRANHACQCAKKWSALNGVSDCTVAQNSWKHSKHVTDVDAIKGAITSFVAEKKCEYLSRKEKRDDGRKQG